MSPTPAEISQGWTWDTDEMVNRIILEEPDMRSTAVLRALAAEGLLVPLAPTSNGTED